MDIWTVAAWTGKVLFVWQFVFMGFVHLINYRQLAAYAASKNVPLPVPATIVTGLMQLAGSAMVLARWHAVWGAGLIALFLLGTALLMHNFWAETDPMQRTNQMAHFGKNTQLAGGAAIYAVAVHFGAL
jgi:uncharacterized membrane protein YphA (DoxX/SURF4 family)